jgi:hypothetical protein
MFCPACGDELHTKPGDKPLICSRCNAHLTPSPLYIAVTLLLSVAVSLVVPYAIGVKAYAVILWIPLLVLSLALVPPAVYLLIPPKPRVAKPIDRNRKVEPWRRNLTALLVGWFACTCCLLIYGFAIGWLAFLVGGTPQDIREINDMFSVPLGWVNSGFVIRPNRSLPAVVGIVFANSFFYSAALLAVLRFVQSRLHQQRTKLGIFQQNENRDDESEW